MVGHSRGCGHYSSGFGFFFDFMDVAERITTLTSALSALQILCRKAATIQQHLKQPLLILRRPLALLVLSMVWGQTVFESS
ncbi:MAG: hypothetical protein DI589_26080 [Shinella sp.]|nr:MAG: hypothetical protein DI589_26080 [Shinella sp.]